MTFETTEPAISSLVPWFGAKRVLAPKIVEVIGPHRVYWEIFCGSMAVLLAKPVVTQETVNDLHRDLTNLGRVIRDEQLSGRLYWKLRRTLVCEDLFRESRTVCRASDAPGIDQPPSVDRAYHYFVSSWQGVNGVAGTRPSSTGYARRFSSKGGAASTRFVGAVESIPWWHQRLRGVEIYNGNGIELAERIEDREGTVIYTDPPYIEKGAEYLHDFGTSDHDRLAAALNRFKETRVVLSYYQHPELDRLYPDWLRIDATTTKGLVQSGSRAQGRVDAPEVLLVNQLPQPKAEAKLFEDSDGTDNRD